MEKSSGSRVLGQLFPGCHIRINKAQRSKQLYQIRVEFTTSSYGGQFSGTGLLRCHSSAQKWIWFRCEILSVFFIKLVSSSWQLLVCVQLFASHYSGVFSFQPHPLLVSTSSTLVSTSSPPGQHKLKHDDTVACFARHGASYMLIRLGGECGLIMELSPQQTPHSFNTNKNTNTNTKNTTTISKIQIQMGMWSDYGRVLSRCRIHSRRKQECFPCMALLDGWCPDQILTQQNLHVLP